MLKTAETASAMPNEVLDERIGRCGPGRDVERSGAEILPHVCTRYAGFAMVRHCRLQPLRRARSRLERFLLRQTEKLSDRGRELLIRTGHPR